LLLKQCKSHALTHHTVFSRAKSGLSVSLCLEVMRMKAVEHFDADEPTVRRSFWDTVQRRYEKIRYGRAGRIIGYLLAFTFIALLIFSVIMVVGYNYR